MQAVSDIHRAADQRLGGGLACGFDLHPAHPIGHKHRLFRHRVIGDGQEEFPADGNPRLDEDGLDRIPAHLRLQESADHLPRCGQIPHFNHGARLAAPPDRNLRLDHGRKGDGGKGLRDFHRLANHDPGWNREAKGAQNLLGFVSRSRISAMPLEGSTSR